MKVMKFGGTSVGSPERMQEVAQIISRVEGKKIVVLSAVSGTTNILVSISEACQKGDLEGAKAISYELRDKYFDFIKTLFGTSDTFQSNKSFVDQVFDHIDQLISEKYSSQVDKMLLAQGEML
ncbi:MAG: aspartate kinase, partial [Marinoscillum sp.]